MMNLRTAEPSLIKNEVIEMSRILIVDDEIDICLMLSKHLQKLKYKTDYVTTVKQTIQHIDAQVYDVLFVDLNLLEGSGYDVIDYAKKLNLEARIIVISAHDSEASRAIEKGADIFIAKPFTTGIINEALKKLDISPNKFLIE